MKNMNEGSLWVGDHSDESLAEKMDGNSKEEERVDKRAWLDLGKPRGHCDCDGG